EIGRLISADQPAEERLVRERIEDDAVARDRWYLARGDARDEVDGCAGGHLERLVAVGDTELGVDRGDADGLHAKTPLRPQQFFGGVLIREQTAEHGRVLDISAKRVVV